MKVVQIVQNDPQREALYLVESEFTPRQRLCSSLTRRQARDVIEKVCAHYQLPTVGLRTAHLPRSKFVAWVECRHRKDGALKGATLFFNNDGMQKLTVALILHEMAHIVIAGAYPDAQDHGPEFVGVLAWLYAHFKVIPSDAFSVILRRYGVRSRSLTESSPSAIRLTGARRAA